MASKTLEDALICGAATLLSSACIALSVAPAQTGELISQALNTAKATYRQVEPTVKTIGSAAEVAAMCSFGVWDPQWKRYKTENFNR